VLLAMLQQWSHAPPLSYGGENIFLTLKRIARHKNEITCDLW